LDTDRNPSAPHRGEPSWPGPVDVTAPAPRRPRRPLPPSVNLLCLVLTFLSTLVAGTLMTAEDAVSGDLLLKVLAHPGSWGAGLPYALGVLAILGAHEMGHYIACRRYGLEATLPFFLPGPNLFGTFGALIRIRSPFTDRRALFDIGVAGPIAGFVVALPVLLYGLSKSTVTLDMPSPGTIVLPPCLLLQAVYPWFFDLAPGASVQLHPSFAAAWLGLFATSLNLLPIGQLDGGHMLYAASPRVHAVVSRSGVLVLVVLGVYWSGYHLVLFGVLFAILGTRHPRPLDDVTPLSRGRRIVAVAGLVIFVLCFIPTTPRVF
jgi:membrane-associated protease RseP (regulator of RpoE activity)